MVVLRLLLISSRFRSLFFRLPRFGWELGVGLEDVEHEVMWVREGLDASAETWVGKN